MCMKSNSFVEFVLEQMENTPGFRITSMFGGHGLYVYDKFFGIISSGRLYFKTDGKTRNKYEERGMECFQPSEKQKLKNYYEIPPDVLEDREELKKWAQEASTV